MALIDLSEKFREIRNSVEKVNFTDVKLTEQFKKEYELYLSENRANGYSKVEWAEFSTKITTSTDKSIFITNFWFYIASELSNYLDGLSQQKDIFKEIYKDADLQKAAVTLRDGVSIQEKSRIESYFTSKSYTKYDLEYFLSFVSDYKSWGGGKTIDRNDYYVSPLLQAGNLLAETQSAVAEIAKQMSENISLKNSFKPIFISKEPKSIKTLLSSGSRGGFAYLLVSFLIKNKIEKPLWECLVEKNKDQGNLNLEYQGFRLTSIFKVSDNELDKVSLERGDKLRFFEKPFLVNSKHYYLSNQWTDGTDSRLDIENLKNIFHALYPDFEIKTFGNEYILTKKEKNNNFTASILSKPFLLLAGISGTGKTRFVREQAELTGSIDETYCLTSVRPDWHEPSDLLGYISRLRQQPHYVATDVLRFIVKAWREIIENIKRDDNGNTVDWHGKKLSEVRPFWLCLDEMNLAPVEQYFADYLSILETRCWNDPKKLFNSDFNYIYECDPLIKGSIFTSLDSENDSNQLKPSSLLAKDLGFNLEDDLDKDIWDYFLEHGISIPFNLIVAGTVNMDETTHGFSRKVIDRALTFDFGEFFPNDFDAFFEPKSKSNALTYPTLTDGRNLAELQSTFDKNGALSIEFLKTVNTVLDNTPFKLAYRALNELLLSVITQKPTDEIQLQAVWDDFLMCKVLPRIEGDIDKLTKGEATKNILEQLSAELSQVLAKIWDVEVRPDLFQTSVDESSPLTLKCRSKAKLDWMNDQLKNGFTSFWP